MKNETPNHYDMRAESHRDIIATIIQRGHIEQRTSDEIAREIVILINCALRPETSIHSTTHIHA